MDAETGLSPKRVFGFLHVSEVITEVDNSGHVGLVEVDSPFESIFAEHLRITNTGVLRQEESRKEGVHAQQALPRKADGLLRSRCKIALGFK